MNDKILEAREKILAREIPPFPEGKYDIILADPPWSYILRDKDKTHRNRCPYPAMFCDDIIALPINEIASEKSYLWLWVTKDHLQTAFSCLQRWQFEYKNLFCWVKTCKKDNTKPSIGVGHWGRNTNEFLLLAVKGKARSLSSVGLRDVPTTILAPRRTHSQKPEEVYKVCERLGEAIGDCKKIELFARQTREGWDSWGNEI